jgi:hypothetical protein
MRYREMRSEHAERGEMSGFGYTVDPTVSAWTFDSAT